MDYLHSYLPKKDGQGAGRDAGRLTARQIRRTLRTGWSGLNRTGSPDGGQLREAVNISADQLPSLINSEGMWAYSPFPGHPVIDDLPGAPLFVPISLFCVGGDYIEIFRMEWDILIEYYNTKTRTSMIAVLVENATDREEYPRSLVRFVESDGNVKLILLPDRVSFDYRPSDLVITPLPETFPPLDHAVLYNSRLFGVGGDRILASAEGDWRIFGISDEEGREPEPEDPWSAYVQSGSAGESGLVAAVVQDGQVVCLGRERGFLLSGTKSPFRISEELDFGALSPQAVATAGGKLFAVGEGKIIMYDGGRGVSIGDSLGISDFTGAVTFGFNDTFYLHLSGKVYTYHLRTGQWGSIDARSPVVMFAATGKELIAYCEDGYIYNFIPHSATTFMFESDILALGRPQLRRIRKIALSAELEEGSRLTLSLVGGDGRETEVARGEGPGGVLLSGRVRGGVDLWHRIRVRGEGQARIYHLSIDAEFDPEV